ncbi:hypothetical protein Drorol1_Dr00011234 [Drosera rotundifolia]
MDFDLRRCRRTDGRKWRCKREVVSNEKYCESHMHRGRARSRKLVETFDSPAYSGAVNLVNLKKDENPKIKLEEADTNAAKNKPNEAVPVKFLVKSGISDTDAVKRPNNYSQTSDRDIRGSHHGKNAQKASSRNRDTKNAKADVLLNTGFDFSPKSVLHGDSGSQKLDQANTIIPEPDRCRRTDGKKWRCRKGVLPEQKYCEMHIHRGSKWRILPSQVAGASTSAASIANGTKGTKGTNSICDGSSTDNAYSAGSSDSDASTDAI